MEYQEAVQAYLRFVLGHLQISPSALAKAAGIASTTLTRFLNRADHKFMLSSTSLEKIAKATGLSPAPFLEGGKAIEFRSVLAGQSPIEDLTTTIVEAESAVGIWKNSEIYRRERFELTVDLPPPIPGSGHFYCAIADDSINLIASKGDYLYCERIRELSDMAPNRREGAVLIVERYSDSRETFETSARVLNDGGSEANLVLQSKDKRFATQSALRLSGGGQEIAILGFAVCVVSPLRFRKR